ncbi:HNH endonuclease [Nocardia sp. NBC_00881]|uniref:HNH endonuclease n=1 Tax=Nocardia sp. NBC_00881 TaxID=2975995 RepID=UPI00386FE11E|nr:HNH endonuclease [Nocardia sp. NBC_00881]
MVADPPWTRDELILACDLVMQNDWHELRQNDPRVVELSALLRALPIHPPERRSDRFRSIDSVSRKTTNLASVHPAYTGAGTHGSKLDPEVVEDFRASPGEMHVVAEAIRKAAQTDGFAKQSTDGSWDIAFLEDVEVREGRLLAARYFRRERDRRLRDKKIATFVQQEGRVRCEICSFDFEAVYGEHGVGYIECHHVVPLHVSGETKTKPADLILLCSNCHRMIHRGPRWLQPNELRELLNLQSSQRPSAED